MPALSAKSYAGCKPSYSLIETQRSIAPVSKGVSQSSPFKDKGRIDAKKIGLNLDRLAHRVEKQVLSVSRQPGHKLNAELPSLIPDPFYRIIDRSHRNTPSGSFAGQSPTGSERRVQLCGSGILKADPLLRSPRQSGRVEKRIPVKIPCLMRIAAAARMDSINARGNALKVPPKKAISPVRPDLRIWLEYALKADSTDLENVAFPRIVRYNHPLIAVNALKRTSCVGQENGIDHFLRKHLSEAVRSLFRFQRWPFVRLPVALPSCSCPNRAPAHAPRSQPS